MRKEQSQTSFDLDSFFEMSPDLICIVGYDGYFKKINTAVSKTLGYTKEELLASPITIFVHPADKEITAEKQIKLINNESLINFENRFIAKTGETVWLLWTSVPFKQEELIFEIAKNITYKKRIDEYERISNILKLINDDHKNRFSKDNGYASKVDSLKPHNLAHRVSENSPADQLWLNNFETAVRKHTGKSQFNLALIGEELAIGERQLYRHIKRILGITPNKLVRMIRLQLAWEAIASGKYRTITEISNSAGYSSRSHFSKLFKDVYGINVSELL